jgi:hypothetical protein
LAPEKLYAIGSGQQWLGGTWFRLNRNSVSLGDDLLLLSAVAAPQLGSLVEQTFCRNHSIASNNFCESDIRQEASNSIVVYRQLFVVTAKRVLEDHFHRFRFPPLWSSVFGVFIQTGSTLKHEIDQQRSWPPSDSLGLIATDKTEPLSNFARGLESGTG